MKTTNSPSSIQDNRSRLSGVLQSLSPNTRFVTGLVICAVVAYYIPEIIIALTGVWVNNLTQMMVVLSEVAILVTQNLIGNKLNKIFLTGIVVMVGFNLYELDFMFRTAPPGTCTWQNWWMVYFSTTVEPLLNAWLFLKFKAVAGLD